MSLAEWARGVYPTADRFRVRCIRDRTSLLWPTVHAWSEENLDAIWDRLILHPDLGSGSFLDKLRAQLAGQSPDVHRVAADLLTFYLLYPSMKTSTKVAIIETVTSWKLTDSPPDDAVLREAFERGVGSPGLYYSLRRDLQLGFYIAFFRAALADPEVLWDPPRAKAFADSTAIPALLQAQPEGASSAAAVQAARNIALALFFPEDFEPIASDNHKRLIIATWAQYTNSASDIDDALRNIRRALTPQPGFGEGFSYYAPQLRPLWQEKIVSPPDDGGGQHPPAPGGGPIKRLAAHVSMTVPQLQAMEYSVHEKGQLILYGPPGSGKTFLADSFARYLVDGDASRVEIIQFHQSYGYEDFIRGIRPTTDPRGALGYHVVDGIFLELCSRVTATKRRHVLVIDEINRGNIARTFGELLLAIEYRGKGVRLAGASLDEPTFHIPEDLYLIGTMNTADRSLAQIDYALRRRFYFYRLDPMRDGRAPILERWLAKQSGLSPDDQTSVLALFLALNNKITEQLGEDFQIGHSYFMVDGIATQEGRDRVWNWSIMPLLDEYFHNRKDRATLLTDFQPERLVEGEAKVSATADE